MAAEPSSTVASIAAVPWWHSVVAGNMGGIVGLAISFPLDTLKVRMMMEPDKYVSLGATLRSMVASEGPASLYRGLTAPVAGYGVINAVAFGSFEWAKSWLDEVVDETRAGSMAQVVIPAAAFAGLVQSFVRGPVELAKTVQQAWHNPGNARAPPFKSAFHGIAHVVRNDGPSALFRGLGATIAREVPQYAIYYPTYALLKPALTDALPSKYAPVAVAAAGALAGSAQWVPTIPVDVIKTRMQGAPAGTYTSVVHCARTLWAEQGLATFFKGTAPALIRAAPLHAGVFLGYDTTMKLLASTSTASQ
ncbi:carnitine/acylcarnitine [Thecamonas trahens ATCC 50062]|uniref:Carnitine/acylcarnitine n=1 Tax=Thecamonas trahens ATCC 50062 TaxID=461836 RepID=A0A0L0D911_THETB|nr:carnitine/acylcarnitine [Thecamonas trahens ATCC 50062]KNC48834.1 carnitine/acylcarnitine [Thecamonas trahens ATCC 50062]|eukprot:XP_013758254.1 carnitine/acylcarnitine [Thecamonas trahens ATCC 50062]